MDDIHIENVKEGDMETGGKRLSLVGTVGKTYPKVNVLS